MALDPSDAATLRERGAEALAAAWKARIPDPRKRATPAASANRPADAAPSNETPRQVVDRLQASMIDIMQRAAQLGFAGRQSAFAKLVDSTHSTKTIAILALGARAWKGLTPAQQQRYSASFRAYSIAQYAGRFNGYKGERFETQSERDARKSKVVRSTLVKGNGGRLTFDWTLRQTGGAWRVVNVSVDGVSDLATKRAEYGAIMKSRGIEGVIAELDAQTRKHASAR